jgi:menaquinol-cytochrome c reductase iron-sulfur subunit
MADLTRRQFARLATLGAGGFATLAIGAPIVGFVFSPLYEGQTPMVWRRVGDLSHLPLRQPTRYVVSFPDGFWSSNQNSYGVYAVRLAPDDLRVFSNICTHMQCAVRWQANLGQFECPCHGGLYTIDGQNVGGPPPKPLPQYVHQTRAGITYVANRLEEQI